MNEALRSPRLLPPDGSARPHGRTIDFRRTLLLDLPSKKKEKPLTLEAVIYRGFDTPEWNEHLYGALRSLSGLAAGIQKKANVMRLATLLWSANKRLTSLFNNTYGILEGKIKQEPSGEVPTPQRLQMLADNVDHLAQVIDYTAERMRRAGMLHNSWVSMQLRKAKSFVEPLRDMADWLNVLAQEDEVEKIMDRARQEVDQGDFAVLRID